jgi:hypothetical protein
MKPQALLPIRERRQHKAFSRSSVKFELNRKDLSAGCCGWRFVQFRLAALRGGANLKSKRL